eukprot:3702752-Alexandrium_andersonii.AAC.1
MLPPMKSIKGEAPLSGKAALRAQISSGRERGGPGGDFQVRLHKRQRPGRPHRLGLGQQSAIGLRLTDGIHRRRHLRPTQVRPVGGEEAGIGP